MNIFPPGSTTGIFSRLGSRREYFSRLHQLATVGVARWGGLLLDDFPATTTRLRQNPIWVWFGPRTARCPPRSGRTTRRREYRGSRVSTQEHGEDDSSRGRRSAAGAQLYQDQRTVHFRSRRHLSGRTVIRSGNRCPSIDLERDQRRHATDGRCDPTGSLRWVLEFHRSHPDNDPCRLCESHRNRRFHPFMDRQSDHEHHDGAGDRGAARFDRNRVRATRQLNVTRGVRLSPLRPPQSP